MRLFPPLGVIIPLGTLVGVVVYFTCFYGFFALQDLFYPTLQEPSAASQHLAIARAVGGLEQDNEREFLSAGQWGSGATGKRAWQICSRALDQNPIIDADNGTVPWQIEVSVTIVGHQRQGCVVQLDWTGSDWLNLRGWAYEDASRGSS